MAKTSITLLILVCFFAICRAKVPLDLPEEGALANREDPSVALAESDVKNTILLPSEKPESEPATVVEFSEPYTASVATLIPVSDDESNSLADSEDLPKMDEDVQEEVKRPLTFVTFHSVNHRFPRFPFRPFFLGRHHHHREISYGNDMIHSEESDEMHHHQQPNHEMLNEESDDIHHHHHHHHHHHQPREMDFGNGMMFHDRDGGPIDLPMRWMSIHHRVGGVPRSGFRGEEGMMMGKHFHHHGEDEEDRRGGFHQKHFHHGDEEEKRDHDDEKEGGVMMRFRKFLNRF